MKGPRRSGLSRRRAVQALGAAGAAFLTPAASRGAEPLLRVAGKDVVIHLTSVSAHTLRLTAGSRMLPPAKRDLRVQMGSETKSAVFDGRPLEVRF